jgi:hypothetical protein
MMFVFGRCKQDMQHHACRRELSLIMNADKSPQAYLIYEDLVIL